MYRRSIGKKHQTNRSRCQLLNTSLGAKGLGSDIVWRAGCTWKPRQMFTSGRRWHQTNA